jgi:hypothetical protein
MVAVMSRSDITTSCRRCAHFYLWLKTAVCATGRVGGFLG